jgi:hypothetical protein
LANKPAMKKTAAKKAAAKKAPAKRSLKTAQDFKEVQKLAKKLELDLKTLQKKVTLLMHDPFIGGIPRPPRR